MTEKYRENGISQVPEPEPIGVMKILVVDDERDAREALRDFLVSENFIAEIAENAQKAMEILEEKSFDLVISDLVMPKTDGIALTRAIKALNPNIAVIVMTGFGTIELAVETMKAGAVDFISKPFKFEHVLHIINRIRETWHLRKLAHEREFYKNLSIIDDLTEINNHRFFLEVLNQEVERQKRYNRPLTLLMIDIDDFKMVNDLHGHLVGDLVLKQMANLFKNSIRGCDIVARYGGEEFGVILPETSVKEAALVAGRILKAVEGFSFTKSDGSSVGSITVTIGLSSYPQHAADTLTLIENADQALYRGKKAGKNQVWIFNQDK